MNKIRDTDDTSEEGLLCRLKGCKLLIDKYSSDNSHTGLIKYKYSCFLYNDYYKKYKLRVEREIKDLLYTELNDIEITGD